MKYSAKHFGQIKNKKKDCFVLKGVGRLGLSEESSIHTSLFGVPETILYEAVGVCQKERHVED